MADAPESSPSASHTAQDQNVTGQIQEQSGEGEGQRTEGTTPRVDSQQQQSEEGAKPVGSEEQDTGNQPIQHGAEGEAPQQQQQQQQPQFAKPSTFLLRPTQHGRKGPEDRRKKKMSATDREQLDGLRAIRAFLKVRTSYDVLPLSYRLIVLDTSLLVKKSLNILTQCGIVSAPLWDSKTSTFAGLLTTSDYINVVQYYWQNPDALAQIDQFKLTSLRGIERALGVTPIETVSTHPMEPLYEACRRMLQSRARRIPLVDLDDETQRDMVVSVITQYRILKFICVNVKETQMLRTPLREIPQMGTYTNVSSARMDTPVIEVIQMLVNRSISSVPIVDHDGSVLNVFESVDVITLIKGGDYENLNLSVGKALEKRPDDFPGIYTCTLNDRLDTIFDTVRKSRVHRFVVIDEARQLKGLLSLSDILDYTLNSPLPDEDSIQTGGGAARVVDGED